MHAPEADIPKSVFRVLVAILLVATAAIVFRAATASFALETHEVFVAQTAREMLAADAYVVPMFGGELRLQKPPLMYWLVSGVAALAERPDVPAWVARAPSAIASLVLVASCIGIGARVYDRRTGVVAGAMLAFCAGVFEYGSNARPEMLYAACTAAATLGFVSASRSETTRASRGWAAFGWAWCALALLAKGPQLPLLVLAGLSVWQIKRTGWRGWARAFHPWMGVAIVTAAVAPWVIAILVRVDGAPAFWANELIGLRFTETEGGGVGGIGAWFLELLTPEYLLYCVSQLLPWGVLLPVAFFVVWQKGRPELASGRDLFFAMVVPLVVLSLATRSREYYLLPMLPIVAVLVARGVIDVLERHGPRSVGARAMTIGLWVVATGGLALAIGVEVASDITLMEVLEVVGAFLTAGAIAVLVVRGLVGRVGARPVVAALAAWGAAFAVMGHEPALWDKRPGRVDALAIEAARLAGGTLPVVTIGFDPDDLIYRMGRPAHRMPRDVSGAEVKARAPAVVVAPPKIVERLRGEGVEFAGAATEFAIEGEERFVVVVVERKVP